MFNWIKNLFVEQKPVKKARKTKEIQPQVEFPKGKYRYYVPEMDAIKAIDDFPSGKPRRKQAIVVTVGDL